MPLQSRRKQTWGARRRIKEKARAEERERKAGQDPEVAHSHQEDLVVLGLALNPERALGLVEVPLPIISVRSAETTSLESALGAKAASGLPLLFANTTKWHRKKGDKLQVYAH